VAGRGAIESLHLVAHGAPGQLFLGNNLLQAVNLDYLSEKIAAWGQFLTQDAQILLYGCETGADGVGHELVQRLHLLTDRLVAAASRSIGHTTKRVNWELDVRSANFQPRLAFQCGTLAEYSGNLAEPYLVKDINSSNSYFKSSLPFGVGQGVADTFYFPAFDGTKFELWKTDGTENGTAIVQDIIPNNAPYYPDNLLSLNGNLYFMASAPNTGQARKLWKTDGVNATLVENSNLLTFGYFSSKLAPVGSKFFFTASSPILGQTLFVSDGSEIGTQAITSSFTSEPSQLTSVNGKLLFIADNSRGYVNSKLKCNG
jgi:ELWxxDGT repeat protein